MQTTTDSTMVNDTLPDLFDALGIESVASMNLGEAYKVERGAYMDLHIEKVDENQLSLAHYTNQNGDYVPNPEVVFCVVDGRFVPVRLEQMTVLGRRVEADEDGLSGVISFVEMFIQNLRRQGFFEAATPDDQTSSGVTASDDP